MRFGFLTHYTRAAALAIMALSAATAFAQHNLPGGGWTYDPAKDGMKDLRALKPIEGCNVPGGLQRITDSDEPGVSTMFWCGTPPFCLTDAAIPVGERCRVVPYSRREPRGDPNGIPGANGVRNPEDLRCENTGLQPINGRCPMPPELTVAITPDTVQVGQNTTLAVNSPHATSLTMTCTGANSAFPPYHESNLNAIAGRSHTFGASQAMLAGTTTCQLTASNPRGSITRTASFVAQPRPPAPTVSASFDPNRNFAAGSAIYLNLRATNATQVRWSCSGRWNHNNQAITVGRTRHTTPRNAGTTNCTFTATGPGGTASTTASWTSTAGSGGGSGGNNNGSIENPPAFCSGPVDFGPIHDGVLCRANPGTRNNGWEAEVGGFVSGPSWAVREPNQHARVRVRCQNGAWRVISIPACYATSGTGAD